MKIETKLQKIDYKIYNLKLKIIYARIGNEGKLRDLPALNYHTILELKQLIKNEFPENKSIQKGEFEIEIENSLSIFEDLYEIYLHNNPTLHLN